MAVLEHLITMLVLLVLIYLSKSATASAIPTGNVIIYARETTNDTAICVTDSECSPGEFCNNNICTISCREGDSDNCQPGKDENGQDVELNGEQKPKKPEEKCRARLDLCSDEHPCCTGECRKAWRWKYCMKPKDPNQKPENPWGRQSQVFCINHSECSPGGVCDEGICFLPYLNEFEQDKEKREDGGDEQSAVRVTEQEGIEQVNDQVTEQVAEQVTEQSNEQAIEQEGIEQPNEQVTEQDNEVSQQLPPNDNRCLFGRRCKTQSDCCIGECRRDWFHKKCKPPLYRKPKKPKKNKDHKDHKEHDDHDDHDDHEDHEDHEDHDDD